MFVPEEFAITTGKSHDVILERGPARKAVGSRKYSLRLGQSEMRRIGAPFEALDFGDGCLFAGELATMVTTAPARSFKG